MKEIDMTRDTCAGWQDCVWSGTEDDQEYFFDIYWQFVWEILFLFWLNFTKTPPWWDGRPHSWDTSQLVSVLHNKYYLFWTRRFLWAPRSGSPGRHHYYVHIVHGIYISSYKLVAWPGAMMHAVGVVGSRVVKEFSRSFTVPEEGPYQGLLLVGSSLPRV